LFTSSKLIVKRIRKILPWLEEQGCLSFPGSSNFSQQPRLRENCPYSIDSREFFDALQAHREIYGGVYTRTQKKNIKTNNNWKMNNNWVETLKKNFSEAGSLFLAIGLIIGLFFVFKYFNNKDSSSNDREDEIIRENNDNSSFDNIKKETPKPEFCTNCGNQYFNKTAFCTNCGKKII